MSAIGNAFESLGAGLRDVFQGAGKLLKGALTLDLRGALEGATQMLSGGMDAAGAAANLTPQAIAVNTMMEGALAALGQLAKMGKLGECTQLLTGLPLPPPRR